MGHIMQKGSHNLFVFLRSNLIRFHSQKADNTDWLTFNERHISDECMINTFPDPDRLSSAGSNGSQQQQNQQPDLRIRRQHSSDSVSSITSATSHSSVGSNMDADAKNKKKNKKNWVR